MALQPKLCLLFIPIVQMMLGSTEVVGSQRPHAKPGNGPMGEDELKRALIETRRAIMSEKLPCPGLPFIFPYCPLYDRPQPP
jgi:hypothetical protein